MKRNEYAEPTEMAGVAEAETEAAYAWALDYDDVDEFPTQRLTSRRITALSIAVSLVVIAVAGVVALVVVRDANQPVAQAPSSPLTETVTRPVPPPPPPPVPTPSVRGNNAANEDTFVSVVFANIPTADIPGGRPTNEELVAYGYQACTVMDRYPGDRRGATRNFYEGLRPKNPPPGPPPTVTQVDERNFFQFMDYAATYLCPRNAATSCNSGSAPASQGRRATSSADAGLH